MITQTQSDKLTNAIITHIEGGYYHPLMYLNGAKNCSGKFIPAKAFNVYRYSGETMMGQDRTAGRGEIYAPTPAPPKSNYTTIGKKTFLDPLKDYKTIESGYYKYISPLHKQFWDLIDNANAKNNWCYEYMGGALENQLRGLVSKIMYQVFLKSFYPKFPVEIQNAMTNYEPLALNVFYTTWNGLGWANRYISRIKNIFGGNLPTDPELLTCAFMQARRMSPKAYNPNNVQKAITQGLKVQMPNCKKKTVSKTQPPKNTNNLMIYYAGMSAILIYFLFFDKKVKNVSL